MIDGSNLLHWGGVELLREAVVWARRGNLHPTIVLSSESLARLPDREPAAPRAHHLPPIPLSPAGLPQPLQPHPNGEPRITRALPPPWGRHGEPHALGGAARRGRALESAGGGV